MVEGVYTLLEKLQKRLDFIVLIVNPKIRDGVNTNIKLDLDFEIMHENYIGNEKIIFLKRQLS